MISSIIINWNTKTLLRRCLELVYANVSDALLHEIIVVDNGSTDDSVEMIKAEFPDTNIIKNTENLGFATACNQAINIASGKYILFLNTDTELFQGTVSSLFNFAESNSGIGLCTPSLTRIEGSMQNTHCGYPSVATELFGLDKVRKKLSAFPLQVESVRGACMFARREAIEGIEGFDENFFLFLEETDLCLRLNKAGYSIWWVPEAKVLHRGGASAGEFKPYSRIEYWRARYKFFKKHYPSWKNWVLRIGLSIKLIFDVVLNFIASLFTLFFSKKYVNKLKNYSVVLAWHLCDCPGTWGISSQNTVKEGEWIIRKGYEKWWNECSEHILKETGNIKIIKDTSERRIIEYKGEVFVKKYKGKYIIKKSPWIREWQLLNRMRQLSIPTLMPIAVGPGYLITKKLSEVETLHSFIQKNKQKLSMKDEEIIINSFSSFLRFIHKKGLLHGDLHAGNILIERKEGKYNFYIIDLHRACLKTYLSIRNILSNLVELHMFFSIQMEAAKRLQFFKKYAKGTLLEEKWEYYAKVINKRTINACHKLWKKRDNLYFKKHKYAVKGKYRRMRYVMNPKYRDISCDLFFNNRGVTIKDSRSSFVEQCNVPGIGEIIIKKYRQKKPLNYLKDLFRNSRAYNSWNGHWSLITRVIETAEPIVALEKRVCGILLESMIIVKYIPNCKNLTLWVRKNWEDMPDNGREEFIIKLKEYINTIHDRGIFPKDCKGSNILVKGENNELSFILIDLDHIERKKSVSLRKRIYNYKQIEKSFLPHKITL